MIKGVITLAVAIEGDKLPTEFRLFKKGWNETENGRFLFDDVAAKAVMASYTKRGIDLPIDLEHQMLEVEGGSPDPTARDARGWIKLELRNGELWACDARWTPDGKERLTNKTQRYVSPAFLSDPKTKRIFKMINVAITAMPATHKTPALVAASANGKGVGMDPSLVKQALEAIEKGDAKAALDILKGLVASAAGAEPEGDAGDADGSEGDGAEGTAPPAETESVEDPKVVDNKDPAADASSGQLPADDDDDDKDDKKKASYKAMRVALSALTGKGNVVDQLNEIEAWRTSHLTLASERSKIAKDRAVLESAERRRLVADLVKLGAEFPATIFADPAKSKVLKPRWAKMPIEELRTHVAEQRAARGEKRPAAAPGVQPPPGDANGESVTLADGRVVTLSAGELKICKDQGCDPKDFAALKAHRDNGGEYFAQLRAREADIHARYGKG